MKCKSCGAGLDLTMSSCPACGAQWEAHSGMVRRIADGDEYMICSEKIRCILR